MERHFQNKGSEPSVQEGTPGPDAAKIGRSQWEIMPKPKTEELLVETPEEANVARATARRLRRALKELRRGGGGLPRVHGSGGA